LTRAEAEEMFLTAVLSGDTCAVEMSAKEVQVFRVLIGRAIGEMMAKNHKLWLKAKDYGIEYREPYAVIRKLNASRFKVFKLEEDGKLTPIVKETEDEISTNNAEENRNTNPDGDLDR
jgi:hypothetical protein